MMSKILYRYEIEYSGQDSDTCIRLRELPVVRETTAMYFINNAYFGTQTKRVSKDAANTYAYDTKQEAKKHFIRRTNKRIAWFEYWTDECKKALNLIEDEVTND